jgi:hypothetical protein
MTIPAIAPYIFERQGWLEDTLRDGGALTGPFTILVGLLIAFRLGDAYKKWDLGTRCLTDLHSSANLVTSMLCCYVVKDDFTAEALKNIRRLMILACVSIARAIRSQKELDMEQQLGLITEQEVYELTEKKMSFSVDGKTDRYPTRNRPQAIFFRLSYEVAELWRKKHIPSPNHHLSIENEIKKMARVCEEVEHLNMTILPLPYAQLTRLVTFLLLIILPYASVGDVRTHSLPRQTRGHRRPDAAFNHPAFNHPATPPPRTPAAVRRVGAGRLFVHPALIYRKPRLLHRRRVLLPNGDALWRRHERHVPSRRHHKQAPVHAHALAC